VFWLEWDNQPSTSPFSTATIEKFFVNPPQNRHPACPACRGHEAPHRFIPQYSAYCAQSKDLGDAQSTHAAWSFSSTVIMDQLLVLLLVALAVQFFINGRGKAVFGLEWDKQPSTDPLDSAG
jgi:hypothetical protein